jgi:mannose-6-phosphate isomerase-like protein (cupin superfamily)
VEEIWFVMAGSGSMWREAAGFEEVTGLRPGTCIAIPAGTAFQFRADTGAEDLVAVAVTMPPWPGPGEASPAEGPWKPTASP